MKDTLSRVAFWGIAPAAYVVCGLFTAFVTAPLLPDDFAIYTKAVAHASAGGDPYHPFGHGLSFVYPPTALLLLWPLTFVPPTMAGAIWAAITGILYLHALRLTWSAIESEAHTTDSASEADDWWRQRYVGAAVLAALLYAPFLETAVVGQTNVLVLLGLVLFAVRRRVPPWIGEAGLAVAIGLKLTPALLLAVPMARRDWRTVGRVVAACLVLVGLSIAAFGLAPWHDFSDIVPRLAADASGSNQAAAALCAKAATRYGATPFISSLLAGVIVVSLIGWLVWTVANARPEATVATELFGVSVVTTASSIVWYHHLTLLAPVVLMTVVSRAPGRRVAIALIGLALIQTDRAWEVVAAAPPIAATAGSLLIAYAAWQHVTRQSRRQ